MAKNKDIYVLKQGDALSPLLFNFASEFALRNVQETRVGLKLNVIAYADDVNLLGDNVYLINKNTETLIDTSREVGLKINVENTKYMVLFSRQNAGQNRDIKIANKSFENVAQFRYSGTTMVNQNAILEEIKRRLNSENACCHSVQNLLSSLLLSKNIKIRIYKTIILPVILYGCEILSLTLREVHSIKVFENWMLRRIFGPKRDEVTGRCRKLHDEELRNLYSSSSIIRMKWRRL
jgi:hypothetical protein